MSMSQAVAALGPSSSAHQRREWLRTVAGRFESRGGGESESSRRLEKVITEVGRFTEQLVTLDTSSMQSAIDAAIDREMGVARERELAAQVERERLLRVRLEHEREMALEAEHSVRIQRERAEHEAKLAEMDARVDREEEELRQRRAEQRARDKAWMEERSAARRDERERIARRMREVFDADLQRVREQRVRDRLGDHDRKLAQEQVDVLRLRDRVWERARDQKAERDAESRWRRLRERERELDEERERRADMFARRAEHEERMLDGDRARARQRWVDTDADIRAEREKTDAALLRREAQRDEEAERRRRAAAALEEQHHRDLSRAREARGVERRLEREGEWRHLEGIAEKMKDRDRRYDAEFAQHLRTVERNSELWGREQAVYRQREREFAVAVARDRELERDGDERFERLRHEWAAKEERARADLVSRARLADAVDRETSWALRRGVALEQQERGKLEWDMERERRRRTARDEIAAAFSSQQRSSSQSPPLRRVARSPAPRSPRPESLSPRRASAVGSRVGDRRPSAASVPRSVSPNSRRPSLADSRRPSLASAARKHSLQPQPHHDDEDEDARTGTGG
eukprot:TRINITY_DN6636_c0_g3_i1.p1 TRINITY_DN6636_c0_g3~~TRINITY_DN6636_c0_g3_i1.p1  ORF type:complete len:581 (+),score=245.11 TRINITY_DN6636_c0_g3_i1:64-1806(+)